MNQTFYIQSAIHQIRSQLAVDFTTLTTPQLFTRYHALAEWSDRLNRETWNNMFVPLMVSVCLCTIGIVAGFGVLHPYWLRVLFLSFAGVTGLILTVQIGMIAYVTWTQKMAESMRDSIRRIVFNRTEVEQT